MPVTVRVQNFQSIKDATVVIDGFTVVTGTNNTGKSALMRAIRAAFQNARGTSFIRHGADKCIVEIDFGDGHTLRWEKGRGKGDKPTYIINGGAPIHPGQGVPDEVLKMGVRPIVVGKDEVWPQFAPQFTGQLFLINQPGSVLAEAVSDVDRVSQLNQALRLAESDKRAASAELKVRLIDEEAQVKELARFDGIDKVAEDVAEVEQHGQRVLRVSKALEAARDLKDRLDRSRKAVSDLAGVDLVDVPDDTDLADLKEMNDNLEVLEALRERFAAATKQEAHWAACLEAADKNGDLDSETAEKCLQVLQELEGLRDRLVAVARRVELEDQEVREAEDQAALADAELRHLLDGMDECPLCGSAIAHDHK